VEIIWLPVPGSFWADILSMLLQDVLMPAASPMLATADRLRIFIFGGLFWGFVLGIGWKISNCAHFSAEWISALGKIQRISAQLALARLLLPHAALEKPRTRGGAGSRDFSRVQSQ
jgi:hypothetical protein